MFDNPPPSEDLRKSLEDLRQRVSALEIEMQSIKGSEQGASASLKMESIKEFLIRANASSDVIKTLLIAYYLEKYEGVTSFNKSDLENGFRQAKERIPANINTTVARNIAKGLIMEVHERKDNLTAWQLTNTGEKAVESLIASP